MSSLPGVGAFSANGVSIGSPVNLLPQFVGRQVIDRTEDPSNGLSRTAIGNDIVLFKRLRK